MDETRIPEINTLFEKEHTRLTKDEETLEQIKRNPSDVSNVETCLVMMRDKLKRSDDFDKLIHIPFFMKDQQEIKQPEIFLAHKKTMITLGELIELRLSETNDVLKAQTRKHLNNITDKTLNEVESFQITYKRSLANRRYSMP